MKKRIVALDRKLGRIWARIGGTVFLVIGLLATMSLVESEGFSLQTHWPGLAIAGLFFLAAIGCFRSRRGLVDTISDSHPDRNG
ncbi:hypothetical protein [Croceicoccus bisphenolivorans]|uniref:hypothetical protein n=1 Tax=Croceicoccus bisphenolivorans TaxID=1783232 RepID=UPI00082E3409|nr:hypothetical protein [Croceicoccus bisphenolivorans]